MSLFVAYFGFFLFGTMWVPFPPTAGSIAITAPAVYSWLQGSSLLQCNGIPCSPFPHRNRWSSSRRIPRSPRTPRNHARLSKTGFCVRPKALYSLSLAVIIRQPLFLFPLFNSLHHQVHAVCKAKSHISSLVVKLAAAASSPHPSTQRHHTPSHPRLLI